MALRSIAADHGGLSLATAANPVDAAVAVAWTRRGDVADSGGPRNKTNARPRYAPLWITDVRAIDDRVCNLRRSRKTKERRNSNNGAFCFPHFKLSPIFFVALIKLISILYLFLIYINVASGAPLGRPARAVACAELHEGLLRPARARRAEVGDAAHGAVVEVPGRVGIQQGIMEQDRGLMIAECVGDPRERPC